MISKLLIAVEDAHFMDVTEDFIDRLHPETSVQVKVFHAIEPDEATTASPIEECRQQAAALVDSTCKRLRKRFPNLKIQGCFVEGLAKQAIVEEATSWGADLILMGPYGKLGADKLLLGSVAQSVLPNSPCSVVLLRAQKTMHTAPSTATFDQQRASN
ncbi:MAG: universal stress protein [Candidatus Melainabacteria bacterium]|nr:universal stress protein [Candidatus Melainabacteria bacterium]